MQAEDSGPDRDWPSLAERLGRRAASDGAPTRWFEELWSAAARGAVALPWSHPDPVPPLVAELAADPPAPDARAVVVGAGLGADAEFVARSGCRTTAFDIAPSALAAVRARHPDSAVDYREANLLDLPAELVAAFDLVVEVFTVQAMDPSVRAEAQAGIRRLIAPGGRALVVQMVRTADRPAGQGPPWLLDRAEMTAFADGDVALVSLDVLERGDAVPLWVARLRRSA